MSRSAFHTDITMGNYREELLKSKETLMMTHGSARTPSKTSDFKFGLKTSPRPTRTYQFGGGSGGGGGESGDYTKSEPNYEKSKENQNEYRERSPGGHNFERNSDAHLFSNSSDKIGMRRGRENAFQRCNTESKKVMLQPEPKAQTSDVGDICTNSGSGVYDGTFESLVDDEWGEGNNSSKNLTFCKSSTKFDNITDVIEEALYGSPRSVNTAVGGSATAVGGVGASGAVASPLTSFSTSMSQCSGIEMNFVVFFGLLAGIAAAKFIQLINHYFAWLLEHVLQIRNFVLGPYSLADLLNFDDGSRFSLRQKLILLPLISLCCLVYSFVSIFNSLLRVSLNPAPKRLVGLLQKWQANQMSVR